MERDKDGTVSEELLVGATWSCRSQDLVGALETLRRAGFHEVEIWAEGVHLDPRVTPDLDAVRTWLEAHPVSIRSVHLPFDAVLPDSPAPDRAQAWVDMCEETLDLAAMLGAGLAVAHPVLFFDSRESRAEVIDRLVWACEAIGTYSQSHGIQLALENMHTLRGPTLRSVAELRAVLDRITCGAGICFDIGHAVFNGHVDESLVGEINDAGELLVNSHIHDSDAIGRDPHLVPGDGIVNWPPALAAFQAADYRGRHVLEVNGGDDPLPVLRRARENTLRALPQD